MSVSAPPVRTMASMAPPTSGSTMSALKRLDTIANLRPAADRPPSITRGMTLLGALGAAGSARKFDVAAGPPGNSGDGDPVDDLDAEALDADDAAVAVGHEADLAAAEVGEDLGAEAEVAQRL